MHNPNTYKARLFLYLSVVAVSFTASFIVFVSVIHPIFIAHLKIYGHIAATESINRAVEEVFSENHTSYSDLVTLDKNTDGSVSALMSDIVKMNKMRAKLSIALEKELKKMDCAYIRIPLGSILGNDLLAGAGPDVKIKIRPQGTAKVDFYDNFEDAGINQSRHTIYIKATVKVAVIMPQARTVTEVSNKIPVAETVIVGNVPKYFGTPNMILSEENGE